MPLGTTCRGPEANQTKNLIPSNSALKALKSGQNLNTGTPNLPVSVFVAKKP